VFARQELAEIEQQEDLEAGDSEQQNTQLEKLSTHFARKTGEVANQCCVIFGEPLVLDHSLVRRGAAGRGGGATCQVRFVADGQLLQRNGQPNQEYPDSRREGECHDRDREDAASRLTCETG